MRWLLLAFLLFFNNLQADFLKAEVGAGVWGIKSSGAVSYHGTALGLDDDLGLDSTFSTYAWANFKHFIPLIPNARLEVTRFGADATKHIPQGIFNDINISNKTISSEFNLDQIDAILYYNLWDTFILIDAGVGLKYYTGSINVANNNVDINIPIPIIYGRIGADIPFTNVGAEMDLKYFRFSPLVDAEMFDLRIKAKATILTIAILDLNIEAGYRVHRLQILTSGKSSFAGFNADIKTEISGFFGGINIAF